MTDPVADKTAIAAVLKGVISAWRTRSFDRMTALFHPDVVFVAPGLQARAVGRKACIDTYRRFAETADINAFHEPEPTIDLAGDTATAVQPWAMEWQHGDHAHRETGYDILVLTRRDGAWMVTWRTMVPLGGDDGHHHHDHDHDHDHHDH